MGEKIIKAQSDKYVLPKEVYEKAKIAITTPKSEPISKEYERCLELVWENSELLMQSIVGRFARVYGSYYRQEFMDVGVDSLLKAIETYNPVEYYKDSSGVMQSRNIMFSTYATTLILNGLSKLVKYYKTQHSKIERNVSSFEEVLQDAGYIGGIHLRDMLSDGTYEQDSASIWQIVPNIDRLIEALNLDDKKIQIIRMFSEGKNQEQIAKVLGVTRANISKIKIGIERPLKMLIRQGEQVAILHEKDNLSFGKISEILGIDGGAQAIYDTYKYVFYDGKRPKKFLLEFQSGSQSYKSNMLDSKGGRQRGNVLGVIRQYASIIDKLLYVINMNEEQSSIIKAFSEGGRYGDVGRELSVSGSKISKVTTIFYVKVQNLQYMYKKISDLRSKGFSDEHIARVLNIDDKKEIVDICANYLYAFNDGEKPQISSQKLNGKLLPDDSTNSTNNTKDIQEEQK